jgi:uncharacterized protein with PIN domain
MNKWGRQNTKCPKCKNPATQTFETNYDERVSEAYCIRYFERLCAVCLYWSGWIWINNGRTKVTIDAHL